ncbi:MAG: hypothetical protein JNK82_06560 [Myxococcaceae bacterium]|nr:hypothetical protein [Myxococcaceae bacterium]
MPAAPTLVLLVALQAGAAVPGVQLSWSSPEGCPSQAQVEGAVARTLGENVSPPEPPLEVSGVITLEAGTWRVQLGTPSGQRTLTGSTCRAVSAAAVVVIALMVDPLAPTDVPALLDEPAEPRAFSVGVLALGDLGTLPRPAYGIGALGSVGLAAGFHLELHGHAWLRQSTAPDADGAGAALSLYTFGVGARRDFDLGPLSLAPLLAVEAGALRGSSFGLSNPATNTAVWVAARAGLGLAVSWGYVRIGLRLEAAVPFTRPRFVAAGVGDLFTPSPISGRGALTLELRFPPRRTGGSGN